MSAEEAEVAAYKRIRTERAIAIAGGATMAAAAAYVAYKHWDLNADKILKSGVSLQNISDTDNLDISSRRFYAAYTRGDKMKYRGLYGTELLDRGRQNIYAATISKRANNLKIAGRKNASEILSGLMKNDDNYRREVRNAISVMARSWGNSPQLNSMLNGALGDIDKGKITKRVYDAFNVAQPVNMGTEKFYNALKKAGYGAIIDINDKKYSGYGTSKPLIVFDIGQSVKTASQLGNDKIASDKIKALAVVGVQQMAKPAIIGILGGGAIAAGTKMKRSASNDRIVQEYRREHPGTELSYNQILNNYYGSK